MPKIYPSETDTTGREKRETTPGMRDTGSRLKKTFGVYDQPLRASRAMIVAFVIAAVVFLVIVIMLVQR